jgi:hypothetical protein
MDSVQPSFSRFPKRVSVGVLIAAGYPILALILLIALFNDLLPKDDYARPTFLSEVAFIIIFSVPILIPIRLVVPLFSKTFREMVTKHKWVDALWAIYSLIFVLGLFVPGDGHMDFKSQRGRDWYTKGVLSQIYTGVMAYQQEYGRLPSTSDNRDLIRILEGDNPHKTVFVALNSWATNAAGDAIDRWDTPIRINFNDPNMPLVESAGPDRVWKTPDDLVGSTNFP